MKSTSKPVWSLPPNPKVGRRYARRIFQCKLVEIHFPTEDFRLQLYLRVLGAVRAIRSTRSLRLVIRSTRRLVWELPGSAH